MEVLILSKTQYGATQVCVGGICMTTNRFIRLLRPGGYYQPADTLLNIGDVWDIHFVPSVNINEPHNEDVFVSGHTTFVKKIYPLETFIKAMNIPIWRNGISNIFGGLLRWTSTGKGYLSRHSLDLPQHSVGFWISDRELNFSNGHYIYEVNGHINQIVYKGNQPPLPILPQGKLIRLSLAKWWTPPNTNVEPRCYLQLSGWYNDTIPAQQNVPYTPVIATPPKLADDVPNNIKAAHVPIPTKINILNSQKVEPISSDKNTKGACYIATLCYGDYYANQVCIFRNFRDNFLKKYSIGRLFILKYYQVGPKLIRFLQDKNTINSIIRMAILNPILAVIKYFELDK